MGAQVAACARDWIHPCVRSHGRTDANHTDFGKGMRKVGWLMHDTSSAGDGFPDWIGCAPNGTLWGWEVKNPDKPPSARKLTPSQLEFHTTWHRCSTLKVVLTVQQALDAYLEAAR